MYVILIGFPASIFLYLASNLGTLINNRFLARLAAT